MGACEWCNARRRECPGHASCHDDYKLWADGVHTERARWRKALAGTQTAFGVHVVPSERIWAAMNGEDYGGEGPREGKSDNG